MSNDLTSEESHFAFGENWRSYARGIDASALASARQGLIRLIPAAHMQGAAWLDIGSGSGIHSLAAHQLGASRITAIDIDRVSAQTTQAVLATQDVIARVEHRSVFDLDDLGLHSIVYSWGVLHHTGAMWSAIEAASQRVAPGGIFVIALYRKTMLCRFWRLEKRFYTMAPELVQKAMRLVYHAGFFTWLVISGRSPRKYVREYSRKRGMSYWHDVHDWLGGYPYESASAAEVRQFMAERGFHPILLDDRKPGLGLTGTACAEYVFERAH